MHGRAMVAIEIVGGCLGRSVDWRVSRRVRKWERSEFGVRKWVEEVNEGASG